MNKIKVYENENDFIELSEDSAELLLCKNAVKISNADFTQFVFNHFSEKWLRTEERQAIFKISKIFWNKYEKLPSKSVFNEIFKNRKFESKYNDLCQELNNIYSFDESKFDDKFIKNALSTYTKNRAIYFTILDKVQDIEQEGLVGDLVERFEKILQIDLNEDLGIEYFENLDEHCNKLLEVNDRIPFGFEKLDRYTYGGLPAKDTCLFLVMAAPGQGKSQFMMNVAANWVLNNKKVLVISLEMSEDMYSRRFDALFANLDPNRLKENINLLKSRIKGVKANAPNSILRIKEFPTGTLTTAMLKQYLKKLKATIGFVPDIIFVDYLNIMKPNSITASTSLYEKCGRISEELRALSSELKIPIFSATQANRGSSGGGYAGENIDISNVSESAGITATVDALIALYQLEGERELGRINVKILKNRLGGWNDTKFPLMVNYETLKMEDWPEEVSVNDDVLGEVSDASDMMFNNNENKTKETVKNSFEDL